MPARTQYEHLMARNGSLPNVISIGEPAPDAPIPTVVEYQGAHGATETYRQELDSEGRLLSISLDGRGMGPYLVRTWTGDDTYKDELANGRYRSVCTEDESGQLVVRDDLLIDRLTRRESDGIVELTATSVVTYHGHDGKRTFSATMTKEGRIIAEEEREHPGLLSGVVIHPLHTRVWEYDDDGNVIAIRKKVGEDKEDAVVASTDSFVREGNTLRVKSERGGSGSSAGVAGYEQERQYDSSGRVEVIRAKIFVPTAAMREVALELSYD